MVSVLPLKAGFAFRTARKSFSIHPFLFAVSHNGQPKGCKKYPPEITPSLISPIKRGGDRMEISNIFG